MTKATNTAKNTKKVIPISQITPQQSIKLSENLNELTKEVAKLKDLEFFQVFKNPWKFFWFSFLKGVMVGLGSIFGVTILLSLIIFLLSTIEFVPIIGDFVSKVISQIQHYQK